MIDMGVKILVIINEGTTQEGKHYIELTQNKSDILTKIQEIERAM
jgi:hypothetical protein